jgi:hypothetical protein
VRTLSRSSVLEIGSTIQCRRCSRRVAESEVGQDFLCLSCAIAHRILPVERNAGRRLHTFLPLDLGEIPELGETDGTSFRDLVLYVRYYAPEYEFCVAELNRGTGEAMGLVRRGRSREWTYVRLADLERVSIGGDIVRRDLEFAPTRARDL